MKADIKLTLKQIEADLKLLSKVLDLMTKTKQCFNYGIIKDTKTQINTLLERKHSLEKELYI